MIRYSRIGSAAGLACCLLMVSTALGQGTGTDDTTSGTAASGDTTTSGSSMNGGDTGTGSMSDTGAGAMNNGSGTNGSSDMSATGGMNNSDMSGGDMAYNDAAGTAGGQMADTGSEPLVLVLGGLLTMAASGAMLRRRA